MTMSSPHPAGWYDDRSRPGWQRWWDGEQWTTHVRHPLPPGQASQPPPPNPILQPRPAALAGGGRAPGWRRPKVLVPAAAGLFALVGVAAALSSPPDDRVVAGSGSSTPVDEEPSSTVTTVAVTAVATEVQATEAPTTAAHTTLPPTTEAPTTSASATTQPPTTRTPTTRTPTTKTPTTAAPSTSVAVKPLVGACSPNYTGACVPIDSDVDCAGGSGNGPSYVRGPVQVVDGDPYGLDADHDGIGCE